MVAADCDSGNEPEYSVPKFSDSDQILQHFLLVLLMCYKCCTVNGETLNAGVTLNDFTYVI